MTIPPPQDPQQNPQQPYPPWQHGAGQPQPLPYGGGPQPMGHGQGFARAPKKSKKVPIILGSIGAVFLLCIGGTVIATVASDDAQQSFNEGRAAAGANTAQPTEEAVAQPAATTSQPSAPEETTAAPATVAPPAVVESPPADEPTAVSKVKMPNLKDINAAVAGDMLTKAGFTNVQFGSQDEFDTMVLMRSNWTVKKQSTKSGAMVSADTLIVLTCTKQS